MDIPMNELVANYEKLKSYVDKRKETCRQSSRKYYNKKFKLSETPTEDELKKKQRSFRKKRCSPEVLLRAKQRKNISKAKSLSAKKKSRKRA